MSRKVVAYIGQIIDIQPIKKADFIVSATVVCGQGGKWMGTVGKDQFQIGDFCEVYLQDAIVPEEERFAFMESYKFRVSMRRFKKVPSECLIMPMTMNMTKYGLVGTVIPNIMKYEKPISAQLAGQVIGAFPTSIIPKTDEPNFQTVPDMIAALKGKKFYSTVKADGSSGTIYRDKNQHFGACSRNLELKPDDKNAFWQMAQKYDLLYKLPNDFGIQFELCGPGIQKNPLGLSELDMRVFNVWDIWNRRFLDANEMFDFADSLKLPTVEVVDWDVPFLFESDEEMRKYAEGKYESGNHREGVVIRPMQETLVNGERLSFKIINLNFKDA